MKPTLIVLAAGLGSRFGGGSLKQIESVGPNNEIILDYSVYDAIKAGFGKVVFVIKEEIEEVFKRKIGRKIENMVETVYVMQDLNNLPKGFAVPPGRVKPWGTAHAVLSCKNYVDGPFGIISADDFYGANSFKLLADFLMRDKDESEFYQYCLIAFRLLSTLSDNGYVSRGICSVNSNGFLTDIVERTHIEKNGGMPRYTEDGTQYVPLEGNATVSMLMMGFTPSIFKELEYRFPKLLESNKSDLSRIEYFLPTAVDDIIKENKARVKVIVSDERWYGVTYKEDADSVRQAVLQMIKDGEYPLCL